MRFNVSWSHCKQNKKLKSKIHTWLKGLPFQVSTNVKTCLLKDEYIFIEIGKYEFAHTKNQHVTYKDSW